MSSFYLIGKDRRNNNISIIKESSRLEEIDNYTVDYHNRHILSKDVNDGLSKDMDFFIVRPIVKGNTTYFDIMDVLYSDSKEIKLVMAKEESANNLVDHFYSKMKSNANFYDMVINVDKNIYPRVKKYFTHNIVTKKEFKEKDGGWLTSDYISLRNMVSSFSKFEKRKRSKKSDSRRAIERLVLEKNVEAKMNEDENQLNFFDLINKEVDYDKLLEVMCFFRHLYEGFIEINNGEVRATNNLLTTYEDLDKLDSLLDQRLAYPLYEYLENRYKYGLAIDEKSKNKYKKIVEKTQKEMIDILISDASILNDAYKWSLIVKINKDRLLGDYHGKQLYK